LMAMSRSARRGKVGFLGHYARRRDQPFLIDGHAQLSLTDTPHRINAFVH